MQLFAALSASLTGKIRMTTAALQALATGMPVIATRHSGFPDLVQDGESGFLVAEGDYEALAEKILYMIDHPELWPSFGRAGRRHIEEKFNSATLINKQIEIYKDLLFKRSI